MMNAQSTTRFRLWIFIGMMAAFALGSFWLLEVMRRATIDFVPQVERTEPDFYVEKFSYIKMSRIDDTRYHVSGKKLLHNPQDDSYDIEQPVLRKLSMTGEPPLTLRAERARVDADNSKIHMYNDVRMDRPASGENEHLQVKSEYLLLLPDTDVIQTDKAVDITVGHSRLTGIGMMANNATREFRLFSHVHGTYQATVR